MRDQSERRRVGLVLHWASYFKRPARVTEPLLTVAMTFAGAPTRANLLSGNMGASGKIELGKGSIVYGTVISTGDSIKLNSITTVTEDAVAYDKIDGSSGVEGKTYPYTAVTPPLPLNFTVTAGGDDIQVKTGEYLDLEPGDYKKLDVQELVGLKLNSGTYVLRSLKWTRTAWSTWTRLAAS